MSNDIILCSVLIAAIVLVFIIAFISDYNNGAEITWGTIMIFVILAIFIFIMITIAIYCCN